MAIIGLCTSAPLDLLLLSRTIMSAALVVGVSIYQSLVVLIAATAGYACAFN